MDSKFVQITIPWLTVVLFCCFFFNHVSMWRQLTGWIRPVNSNPLTYKLKLHTSVDSSIEHLQSVHSQSSHQPLFWNPSTHESDTPVFLAILPNVKLVRAPDLCSHSSVWNVLHQFSWRNLFFPSQPSPDVNAFMSSSPHFPPLLAKWTMPACGSCGTLITYYYFNSSWVCFFYPLNTPSKLVPITNNSQQWWRDLCLKDYI